MKKGVKNKKMTIDKLAIMMNNSFEILRKDVADNTKVSSIILKEITAIHQDTKKSRLDISSLTTDGLSYNRKIENLTIRVEKLESNSK